MLTPAKLCTTVLLLLAPLFMNFSEHPSKEIYSETPKIGFLVHDLVSERWKRDMDIFSEKVTALGGEAITRCAYGDDKAQIEQGKQMIAEGVKVIAIVPVDGRTLAELVDYADSKGVKIIAYDRLIKNCNLHYYISFNSVRVGELMAEYILKLKPKGTYAIVSGPSTDNNATLIKQGQMNKLKPYIDRGDVKIVMDKAAEAWGPLESLFVMNDFLDKYKGNLDAVLVASDGLSEGVIQALAVDGKYKTTLVTGQDAGLTACKNIIAGQQTMSVYKSITKIATEAAILAMKIAKNEKIETIATINNGKKDVPSILFEPVVVDKSNLKDTVVKDGHIKETDL